MKLTVLIDNFTYIDQYYLGEPALSFYLEDEGKKILFDTGYSDAFISNAKKLGIDLSLIDSVVLSHGHNDHTGGLSFLAESFDTTKMDLYAVDGCFKEKYYQKLYIGSPMPLQKVQERFITHLSESPVSLSSHLTFLGKIPRENDFENREPIGYEVIDGKEKDDYLLDDSAIVYDDGKEIFIITACSHAGVCNIVEYAKKVTGKKKVSGVIGGFHLFEEDEQLRKTISCFEKEKDLILYPCHCVSLSAKHKMMERLNVKEVGVGLTLNL